MASDDKKPTPPKKAVALQYNHDRDTAPRIVASGRGAVADHILSLAQDSGVPMHEDRALVETLLAFEIGKEIPAELYQVVAEVLAFVQRLDKRDR
ncbi:EscU/YscU/HrcU family type III secretion system export apparatus switch protein [Tumebacillus sp. ITR2]|uniref:EscU/YscU/HrcU family type III secretion system export apparatus switch protein n=1 Tax=Tumebacillus amylolyticus TaxID=2801339 RepID=A0ABS1JFV3_9BACL|nr:EscU/YscU/HrcU family type III secretion system export apparatus switch protein [Tumebacillus amylolyticus]MBL0388879.1 EscU/YscU/HrcU family type III secretion system export apparatus switch protein [Tumebacillus amylolyticus]